jgi:hypothetical protein
MRAVAWLLPVLALAFAACGGMSDRERFQLRTPGVDDMLTREVEGSEKPRLGKPTRAELKVIRAWATAMSAGRIVEAAALFDVPVAVADGVHPQASLSNRQSILAFNRNIACGQRLLESRRGAASKVIATFKLTERPGARGECGKNVGLKSETIFVVENDLIQQWLSAGTALRSDGGAR